MELDRRGLMAGLAGLGLPTLLTSPAAAAAGSELWLRLVSDLSGDPVFAVTRGDVWGFKPQADDLTPEAFAKKLYGYWSLAARQTRRGSDGSLALTTKAWSFYLDPLSGAVVDQIVNPYHGVLVSCPPLSGQPSTVVYAAPGAGASSPAPPPLDLTERRLGEHAWIGLSRISRFKPADTTWYKLEADLTSYACRAADIDNPALTHVSSTWSQNLVAEWQTWMRMHGEPGHILFKGEGAAVPALEAAPPDLLRAIETHFPGTAAAVAGWRR